MEEGHPVTLPSGSKSVSGTQQVHALPALLERLLHWICGGRDLEEALGGHSLLLQSLLPSHVPACFIPAVYHLPAELFCCHFIPFSPWFSQSLFVFDLFC